MPALLPDKVLSKFLHNPVYERDGFRMWGRILDKYDPRGKDALFESISALYTIEQVGDETISSDMSRACRLFSSLHGFIFNTMANLSIIVNSDCSCFGVLANCFCAGNPEVVKVDMDRLETLLEVIESCSRVVDSQPTPRPSALRSSAPAHTPPQSLHQRPTIPRHRREPNPSNLTCAPNGMRSPTSQRRKRSAAPDSGIACGRKAVCS